MEACAHPAQIQICVWGWGGGSSFAKARMGRPETDGSRRMAISLLGNGLEGAEHYEDALAVYEAELSMLRRVASSEVKSVLSSPTIPPVALPVKP